MSRPPPRILPIAAMVLLIGTTLAAVRSHWAEDHITLVHGGGLYLTSSEGRLRLQYVGPPPYPARKLVYEQSEPLGGIDGIPDHGVQYHLSAAGAHVGHAVPDLRLTGGTTHVAPTWWLVLPYWCLAAPAALLPLRRVLRVLRGRARRRRGRCPQCGYDLRASPRQCPECGTEPTGHPDTAAPPHRSINPFVLCVLLLCFAAVCTAGPLAKRTRAPEPSEHPLSRRLGRSTDDPLLARRWHRYQQWETSIAGTGSAVVAETWLDHESTFRLYSNAAAIDPYNASAARGAVRTALKLANAQKVELARRRIIREANAYRFNQAIADARLALAQGRLPQAQSGIDDASVIWDARRQYFTAEELTDMRNQITQLQSDLSQAKSANESKERSR